MINHVRTLLLNRDGFPRQDSSFYLEEFIDPTFKAITLPSALQAAHNALVEQDSDDAFANFRLQQYIRILGATEFEAYTRAFDSRITYMRPAAAPAKSYLDVLQVANATTRASLSFTGFPTASSALPRLINKWKVQAMDFNQLQITHQQTGEIVVSNLTFSGGVSSAVSLPTQSDFIMRVRDSILEEDQEWWITTFTEPEADLSDVVMRLAELDSDVLAEVFQNKAPYTIFRELWDKNAILAYRLSGFLLAMAYSIEEVRNA